MKTILALATTAAALFGAASLANAQDCVGGYRWMKDEIPLRCTESSLPSAFAPRDEPLYTGSIGASTQHVTRSPVLPQEPLTTGSINPPQGVPTQGTSVMVDSREACAPGKYWTMSNPNGPGILVPCT